MTPEGLGRHWFPWTTGHWPWAASGSFLLARPLCGKSLLLENPPLLPSAPPHPEATGACGGCWCEELSPGTWPGARGPGGGQGGGRWGPLSLSTILGSWGRGWADLCPRAGSPRSDPHCPSFPLPGNGAFSVRAPSAGEAGRPLLRSSRSRPSGLALRRTHGQTRSGTRRAAPAPRRPITWCCSGKPRGRWAPGAAALTCLPPQLLPPGPTRTPGAGGWQSLREEQRPPGSSLLRGVRWGLRRRAGRSRGSFPPDPEIKCPRSCSQPSLPLPSGSSASAGDLAGPGAGALGRRRRKAGRRR